MKRLITNNFLYYFKSLSKVILSIAFVLSFIGIVFVYDNLELSVIKSQAGPYRTNSSSRELYGIRQDYLKQYALDNNIDNLEELYNSDNISLEHEELMININSLDSLISELSETLNGFSSLHAGGRMNLELTPYRLKISDLYVELAEIVGWENLIKSVEIKPTDSINYFKAENKRLHKLELSQTPDYFNDYTVTVTNYPSKALEGLGLFTIFIFILFLFYDLFSKDFDYDTYRTIFTEPYSRKTIIKSRLAFAFLYTIILILIGMLITIVYLSVQKRVGYNVHPSRMGYILHPVLLNINPLVLFNLEPVYLVVPVIIKNIITILISGLLITLFLLFVCGLSFKLKSSASTLTISSFILISLIFVFFIKFDPYISLIIPLFGFGFNSYFSGYSFISIFYLIILTLIYIKFVNKVLFKDISNIDMLGGDDND